MERSKFIEHKGREIYILDFTDCTQEEIIAIINECARLVRSRPEKSVRTLTIVNDVSFNNKIVGKLSDLTLGNAPYVDKAAVVGMTGLHKVLLSAIEMFSKREFHGFDLLEEALDFLAEP